MSIYMDLDDYVTVDEAVTIELPTDADGVPIFPGDVLEDTHGQPRAIDVLELHRGGRWTAGEYGSGVHLQQLSSWRHYHKTVEDVLREFVETINQNFRRYTSAIIDADEWHNDNDETIAEYAKRLTLVDDAK